MIYLLATIIITTVLQVYLSLRDNKWIGLILPIIFLLIPTIYILIMMLTHYSSAELSTYFNDEGIKGVLGQLLKISIFFLPAIIDTIIYIVCRKKKMIVDDLD